jgi:hypothetical protein
MTSDEYIATGAAGGDFTDLIEATEKLPDASVKKVGARYVVIVASESAVRTLTEMFGSKYTIAPNRELKMFE